MPDRLENAAVTLSALSPGQRNRLRSILSRKQTAGTDAKTILRNRRATAAPLSLAQMRVWLLDRLEPGNPVYSVPSAIQISGALGVEALEASLNEILRRHEILRARFLTGDGEPRQVINAMAPMTLEVENPVSLAPAFWRAEALRRATEAARRPFDLSFDALFRAHLIRFDAQTHVLILNIHHIVADGWSVSILHRELGSLYRAFVEGKSSPLPELPIQYSDYASWQREWLQGPVIDKQIGYWKGRLSGAPSALELPACRPRRDGQGFSSTRQFFRLSRDLTLALKALSRANGATLFMTLLTAFKTLLSRYGNQQDIVVGAPVANRNHAETEGLIGLFVNVLPLRTDCSGNPVFRELLSRVRDACLGAYAHQDLPFDKLIEALRPRRSLSQSALFPVIFNFQNMPIEALQLTGLDLRSLAEDTDATKSSEAQHFSAFSQGNGTGKFDLSMFMWEQGDGLRGRLMYNAELFDDSIITRMLLHFKTLLSRIAERADARLDELTGTMNRQEVDGVGS